MRHLVRSSGVISTSTLSPASTRMRFLRMRPAVWAMISCSFSSLTRNVAFGSSSVTTPGNSSSSSFAIRNPAFARDRRTAPAPKARKLAESRPSDNCRVPLSSFVGGSAQRKARPDPRQELVAHLAVRVQPLLAAAFDRGRIGGGPVLDLGGERARELERLVVRLGRQRHDEVEVEPLQVLELLEGDRPVRLDVDADLLHRRGRERIEL